jgi:hypothetical protein
MPKGGARTKSGPAPSLTRVKSQHSDWLTLPAGGYVGRIPTWPFPDSSAREKLIWAKLWRRPQAAAWISLAVWPADVAMFVRLSVAAEEGDLKSAAEARQWNDRLGLNPDAMLRKRWKISTDEVTPKRAATKSTGSRGRLKSVGG